MWLGVLLIVIPLQGTAQSHNGSNGANKKVVEDFESYEAGELPSRWKFVAGKKEALPLEEVVNEREKFYVEEEDGNKFVRAYTEDEAQRITLRNGTDFEWDLDRHPHLQWEWRALRLPEGASERGKNDTGAAVYVTFGEDWLGRPKSIKYTYSSTLPVGSVVNFGPLKVLVVSSGADSDTGEWKTIRRDVIADHRQLFGGGPPNRPLSITLWSDSDSTHDVAEADFDNFALLPARR